MLDIDVKAERVWWCGKVSMRRRKVSMRRRTDSGDTANREKPSPHLRIDFEPSATLIFPSEMRTDMRRPVRSNSLSLRYTPAPCPLSDRPRFPLHFPLSANPLPIRSLSALSPPTLRTENDMHSIHDVGMTIYSDPFLTCHSVLLYTSPRPVSPVSRTSI